MCFPVIVFVQQTSQHSSKLFSRSVQWLFAVNFQLPCQKISESNQSVLSLSHSGLAHLMEIFHVLFRLDGAREHNKTIIVLLGRNSVCFLFVLSTFVCLFVRSFVYIFIVYTEQNKVENEWIKEYQKVVQNPKHVADEWSKEFTAATELVESHADSWQAEYTARISPDSHLNENSVEVSSPSLSSSAPLVGASSVQHRKERGNTARPSKYPQKMDSTLMRKLRSLERSQDWHQQYTFGWAGEYANANRTGGQWADEFQQKVQMGTNGTQTSKQEMEKQQAKIPEMNTDQGQQQEHQQLQSNEIPSVDEQEKNDELGGTIDYQAVLADGEAAGEDFDDGQGYDDDYYPQDDYADIVPGDDSVQSSNYVPAQSDVSLNSATQHEPEVSKNEENQEELMEKEAELMQMYMPLSDQDEMESDHERAHAEDDDAKDDHKHVTQYIFEKREYVICFVSSFFW